MTNNNHIGAPVPATTKNISDKKKATKIISGENKNTMGENISDAHDNSGNNPIQKNMYEIYNK